MTRTDAIATMTAAAERYIEAGIWPPHIIWWVLDCSIWGYEDDDTAYIVRLWWTSPN